MLSFIAPIPSEAATTSPVPVCVNSECTISFPFVGDYYTWNAPGTGTYTLEAWGAQGGSAGWQGTIYREGGKGGYASGAIALTAGEQIYIYVGGQGEGESSTSIIKNSILYGGFNGGGNGYNGTLTTDRRGAGGGGATDFRVGGNALTDRKMVAGGGGGVALLSVYGVITGGTGGGTNGGNATNSNYSGSGIAGSGATQSAGGAGGANGGYASAGVSGIGGDGVPNHDYGSTGGGGGYFGGGGGGVGAGAGGGSGYIGGVTTATLTSGNATMPKPTGGTMTGQSRNGFARISYSFVVASASVSIAGSVKSVTKGQPIVLTASSTVIGKVTFYADNKRIGGCVGLSITIGTRTCSWKPSTQKTYVISAAVTPNAVGSVGISNAIVVSAQKRTGTR
jgi:hypothetical protein